MYPAQPHRAPTPEGVQEHAGSSPRFAVLVLCAFAASLAFMRPRFDLGGLSAVGSDPLFALAATATACRIVLRRAEPRWHPIFAWIGAYYLVMLLSALGSSAPFYSFVPRLFAEAYLITVPVVLLAELRSARDLRLFVVSWLAGSTVVVACAAVSIIGTVFWPSLPELQLVQHHLGSLPLGPLVRFKLTYENPNMLGAYLSASLMMALLAIHLGWLGRRCGAWLVAGIFATTVITYSAGIGGCLLMGSIWLWQNLKSQKPREAKLVLAIGILCGTAFVVAQALTPVPSPAPFFAIQVPFTPWVVYPSSRFQVWAAAATTFMHHPLLGVGIGKEVTHVIFVEPAGAVVLLTEAHNVLLNLAAECGLLALLVMLALMREIWRLRTSGRPNPQVLAAKTALVIAILGVLAYQGIGGSFEDARFVWAMLGLLLAFDGMGAGSHSLLKCAGSGVHSPEAFTQMRPKLTFEGL